MGTKEQVNSANASIERHIKPLSKVRRHLHRNPELSGHEYETTRFLANELSKSSIPYRLGPDSRGLIVDLGNPEAERRLAIRADIDAIAVMDSKDVDYKSTVKNVMHACGHDAHSSILLGTIRILHELLLSNPSEKAIRAIFQPEEEVAKGAAAIIKFGVLDGVTSIIAGHVDPTRMVGKIGLRSGVNTAHCNEISVEVRGRGGHAARPYETIDPIEIGAKFIADCYEAVPRYTDAAKKVVISFTAIHGGESFNVIPDTLRLSGTMRSLDANAREKAKSSIQEIACRLAEKSGAEIKVEFGLVVPSVITDQGLTDFVWNAGTRILGNESVEEIAEPSMGGEDFAFYCQEIPASFVRIGCCGNSIGNLPLHNSGFDVDERVIGVGVNLFTNIAQQFLYSDS